MTQAPFDSFGAKKPGCWRRQFTPIPTRAQDSFDSICAVVMPIIVLLADPMVFKGGDQFWTRGLLEDYQLLAYLVCRLLLEKTESCNHGQGVCDKIIKYG